MVDPGQRPHVDDATEVPGQRGEIHLGPVNDGVEQAGNHRPVFILRNGSEKLRHPVIPGSTTIGHGQVAGGDMHGLDEAEHVAVVDHMEEEFFFLQRVPGCAHAVLITPSRDTLREVLREDGPDGVIEMPAHDFGRRVGASVERGQHFREIVAVAVPEALWQPGVPRDESDPAGPLGRIFAPPKGHQVGFVGIEGIDLSLQRTEALLVFLVREREKSVHRGRTEQIRVAPGGLELPGGAESLRALVVDLQGVGPEGPSAGPAIARHHVVLHLEAPGLREVRLPVDAGIEVSIDEFFGAGRQGDRDRTYPASVELHLDQTAGLMGRVCFDHTPSRHAARVTVVVRDPELQTGTFDLRDVVAHIIPSLFGLQIAVSLHEQLDPADAGRSHLLHRHWCAEVGAVVR